MNPSALLPYQQQLTRHVVQQNLPHALLFTGVDGVGKQYLANWLVQVLLCQHLVQDPHHVVQPCQQCKHCLLYQQQSFPDHLNVHSEKNSLGVDDIRQANHFLQKTAQMSGVKTVLVGQAQTMTESAANALLKTLEEPSASSILILLANDAQQLLPTIISRCRLFSIRPQLAEHQLIQTEPFNNYTHIDELTNTEQTQAYQHFVEQFYLYVLQQQNVMKLSELIANSTHGIRWLEKLLVNLYRQSSQWLQPLNNEPLASLNQHVLSQVPANVIYQCYQTFLQHQQQLVNLTQANKAFVIEKMLLVMQQQIKVHEGI